MAFADLLVELRTARGLSQETLAERTAVSLRAIGDLERGITRRPQRHTVKALADGLGITGAERAAFEEAAKVAPPKAVGRRPSELRLPAPTSSIVGRDADIGALSRLLRTGGVRLVTVTGPGGVGKTRLAAEVAWQVGARFERVDGTDLSPVRAPEDVPAALAAALGCTTGAPDPVSAVAAMVGDRPWLLVLDSVEHVLDGALVLADLLGRCARLRLLVTSRAALRLRGEHLWPLAPLPVPAPEEEDPAALGTVPAMALLVERVRAVRPGFALTGHNASALRHLCRRLDGLPLAIELAAAQLRTLHPADLLAQLDGPLAALRAEAVDVPDRQQTLRSTVEWSAERLGDEPRLVLNVLSSFYGGATPALLRKVFERAGFPTATLDSSVSLLAAMSLIGIVDRDGGAHLTMLDTIRDVAGVLLEESGRAVPVRRAHASVILDVLRDGTAGDVDAELGNVRAGLRWAIAHEPAMVDRAAVDAFIRYGVARSGFRELDRVLGALAEVAPDDVVRAAALRGAGVGANETGNPARAAELAGRAVALFEKLDDLPGRCAALTLAGNADKARSDFPAAKSAYRACLELAEAAGYTRGITVSLNNLGTLAHNEAEYQLALDYYRRSLQVKREVGDDQGAAVSLMNLGAVANDLGDHERARPDLEAALEILGEHGSPYEVAFGLILLGEARCGLGELDAAGALLAEGLRRSREVRHDPTVALALTRLGDLALKRGDERTAQARYREALAHAAAVPETARTLERLAGVRARSAPEEARELLANADGMRRAHGIPVPPVDRLGLDRTRALLASG